MTRSRQVLDGLWRYTPQAQQTLKPGGVLVESTDNLPAAGEMQIPCNWQLGGLDNFHGRVRFEREFEFAPPTGLEPQTAQGVWLVFGASTTRRACGSTKSTSASIPATLRPLSLTSARSCAPGPITCVVEVSDPLEEPGTVWPDHKQVIKGVLSHWDCRPGSWSREHGQDRNCGGIWHCGLPRDTAGDLCRPRAHGHAPGAPLRPHPVLPSTATSSRARPTRRW